METSLQPERSRAALQGAIADLADRCRDLRHELTVQAEQLHGAYAALAAIKLEEGKVCAAYEECDHVACASSYASWATADEALRTVFGQHGLPELKDRVQIVSRVKKWGGQQGVVEEIMAVHRRRAYQVKLDSRTDLMVFWGDELVFAGGLDGK